jgi:hypothetical protein
MMMMGRAGGEAGRSGRAIALERTTCRSIIGNHDMLLGCQGMSRFTGRLGFTRLHDRPLDEG